MSAPELVDEPDALGGLTGGDVVDQVKRSVVRRFAFPPQEYKFKRGDTAVDPAAEVARLARGLVGRQWQDKDRVGGRLGRMRCSS